MPIVWRFFLWQFLKVTIVCIIAFIAILLTMRLDEIAHFASLGAAVQDLALFTFYQIPYILPIAIPISCLISSMILIQRLSKSGELTALRACGFGLKTIFTPLLFSAAVIAFANFYIVSEVATQSHLITNNLKSKLRSINPLLILHNKHLMRLKGIYFDAMGPSRLGEYASDVIIAMPNKNNKRLSLLIAKQLISENDSFKGKKVTLLTSLKNNAPGRPDPIAIENMETTTTTVADFADLLQKKAWKINNDYLTMNLLLVRIRENRIALDEARRSGISSEEINAIKSEHHLSISEIFRRFSMSFAAFNFTLLGSAFGLSIGRKHSHSSIYIVICLATLFLVAFFVAKGLEKNWILAAALYGLPHILIIAASLTVLSRISKGME